MRRAQTASEYLMLVSGVIFFALFIFLAIKGELVRNALNPHPSQEYLDEYGHAFLAYDTFDSGRLIKWHADGGGTWAVDNRALSQQNSAGTGDELQGDSTWTNYVVAANVQPHDDTVSAGVTARFNSGFAYRCFQRGSTLYLTKDEAQSPTMLAFANFLHDSGQWLTISLSVNSSDIKCTIHAQDGTHVLSASDASYYSGQVGLYAAGKALFENFKVTKLPDLIGLPGSEPGMNGLSFEVSFDRVFIHWENDAPANATLFYGTDVSLAMPPALNATLETVHSQTQKNLLGNTLYYFKVMSCTAENICTNSSLQQFTTTSSIITGGTYMAGEGCGQPTGGERFVWDTPIELDSHVWVSFQTPGCEGPTHYSAAGGYDLSCTKIPLGGGFYKAVTSYSDSSLIPNHEGSSQFNTGSAHAGILTCGYQGQGSFNFHLVSCYPGGGCMDSGMQTFTR